MKLNIILSAILFTIYSNLVFSANFSELGLATVNNCSAALIRLNGMNSHQKAIVATNAHCLLLNMNFKRELPYPLFAERLIDISDQNFLEKTKIRIYGKTQPLDVKTQKLIFATISGTDIALFELMKTYQEIEDQFKIRAIEVDSENIANKTEVVISSALTRTEFKCSVIGSNDLVEGAFWTQNALILSSECDVFPGVSGSPIILKNSGKAIGLVHTVRASNKNTCGFNEPCFLYLDQTKEFEYPKAGTSFGIDLQFLYSCYNRDSQMFDFNSSSCLINTDTVLKPLITPQMLNESILDARLKNFQSFAKRILDKKNIQLSIKLDNDWQTNLGSAYLEGSELRIEVGAKVFEQAGLTDDTLDLILCHELGHFMGVGPKKINNFTKAGNWASTEGESDYFAGSCVLQLWGDKYKKLLKNLSWQEEGSSCNRYQNYVQISLCERAQQAALTFYSILNAVYKPLLREEWKPLSLTEKDLTVASETIMDYPSIQCRLDSAIAGIMGFQRPACWSKTP